MRERRAEKRERGEEMEMVKMAEGRGPKGLKLDINLINALINIGHRRGRVKREESGPFKGLYTVKKSVGHGEIVITNGAGIPGGKALSFLLMVLEKSQNQGWNPVVKFNSLSQVLENFYGRRSGENLEKLKRTLILWKNHGIYFHSSFYTGEGKVGSLYLSVIDEFRTYPEGRGKALEIRLNKTLIDILRNSDWYRLIETEDFKNLRKEVSKALFLYLYKRKGKGDRWEVYLPKDLKKWYVEELGANAKNLRPSVILENLRNAVEEISRETHLEVKLEETDKGNYCLKVKHWSDEELEIEMHGFEHSFDDGVVDYTDIEEEVENPVEEQKEEVEVKKETEVKEEEVEVKEEREESSEENGEESQAERIVRRTLEKVIDSLYKPSLAKILKKGFRIDLNNHYVIVDNNAQKDFLMKNWNEFQRFLSPWGRFSVVVKENRKRWW